MLNAAFGFGRPSHEDDDLDPEVLEPAAERRPAIYGDSTLSSSPPGRAASDPGATSAADDEWKIMRLGGNGEIQIRYKLRPATPEERERARLMQAEREKNGER